MAEEPQTTDEITPQAAEYEPEDAADAAPALTLNEDDKSPTERANLAAAMTDEEQKAIAMKVRSRYDGDLSSRAERMKHLEAIQKMYALIAEEKQFPYRGCANIKTPALTGPALQIQARLYDMIWPMNGKVSTVVPATAYDAKFATATERFFNTYVRYKMPYMAQGLDDTTHQMTLYGSSFRRTYWNGYERKVRSDWVPIEDFVVSYSERSQDPSMSDVRRYTMVHHMSLYDIQAYGRDGMFINSEKVKGATENESSSFKATADKIAGQAPDTEDEDLPRQVLEQHCKWRLPNAPTRHPAFDGLEHYVVITMDAQTNTILRISLREEDDPDDRRRYDREQAAYEQYSQAMDAYMAAMQAPPPAAPTAPDMAMGMQPEGPPDVAMTPPPPDMTADSTMPMAQSEMAAPPSVPNLGTTPDMALPPQMLARPEPVAPPTPIRKRQICFFTHYRCFPSEGFYGLGYGDLIYGLAMALNTSINQHLDGVAFKNAKPMFMSRNLRMQRGNVNIRPGQAIEIDAPLGQIKEAIMFLDPPQNDPSTVPLIKLLESMPDRLAGNADLMSGQAPGSNQTKAGMQMLQENMMQPITVLARRVREAFGHELTKIWRCIGVFLTEDDFADIAGDAGPEDIKVSRDMFTPTARLVPASDPRVKSQRMEDHQMLMGYIMNSPLLKFMPPPQAMGILGKLTEMGLRVLPDGEPLIPMMQPPPPPPPPQPMPQWAENAGFLRGQDHPVLPPDDDESHIQELMVFLQSPDAQVMDKTGREMAEKHLRDHVAQRLTKGREALEQQQPGIPGPGPGGPPPGGPPGMAPPPGIEGPPGPPPGGM